MEKEKGVDFAHADPVLRSRARFREEGHFYMPVSCQQCRESAVHQGLPDRRDLDREGRHRRHRLRLVHRLPLLHGGLPLRRAPLQLGRAVRFPPSEINPNTHYLGNRPRPKGVVEKCTFCIQRTRDGRYPACVEVCPVGARKFGNLLDPDSEIRYIIEHKRVLRAEGGTEHRARGSSTSMQRESAVNSIRLFSGFTRGSLKLICPRQPGVLGVAGVPGRADRLGRAGLRAARCRPAWVVTAMRDQVSWGFYIGNFTFLVGVAAAAVVLVIPAYIYDWKPIREIVIYGELLAISAIMMCLLFVMVDIGRPDRFWHLIPLVRLPEFPALASWRGTCWC